MLPENAKFGGWSIWSKLGTGGQGTVWKAKSTNTDHHPPRALKACFSEKPNERARFEREIDILTLLKGSQRVLRVVDHDKAWVVRVKNAPEFAYYVSDRCDGSLDQRKDDLGNAFARIDLFRQACEAVVELHELPEPVIHRDIKPGNFLLASEPRRLVIADFGIARPLKTDQVITQTQEVLGSQYFRAPEALSLEEPSVRMDVFSLGRLLEWLLTGDVSKDLVPRPVPRQRDLADDVADTVDALIARATQPVIHHRFATVREMLNALPPLWVTIRPAPRAISTSSPSEPDGALALRKSSEAARGNDRARWREEEMEERRRYVKHMFDWRTTHEGGPVTNDRSSILNFADSLIRPAVPRIAFALGGAFSQRAPFEDQRRTLEELVSITGWNWGGNEAAARAPLAIGFVFNYLHGSLCCELRREDLALALARELVVIAVDDRQPRPLVDHHELVGWPRSIGGNFQIAAAFLHDALSRYPVLASLFTDLSEYQTAIASYSMLLTLVDLADSITMVEKLTDASARDVMLGVPPMFSWFKRDLIGKAAHRTIGNAEITSRIAKDAGIEKERLVKAWPRWKQLLNRMSPDEFYGGLPLGDLR